jgi:hypothetical protein
LRARQAKGKRSLTGALALGAFCMLVPTSARAHFVLQAPASWSVLDQNSGLPEKLGPCGNESMPVASVDDAGQPVITAFQEGDMITVTIHEVVPHPGHYRISLSTEFATAGDTDQAGFPEEPVVTAGETNSGTMMCPTGQIVAAGSSPCGSVPLVKNTPVAVVGGWILADDVFEHCEAFTSPQTIKVALPAGVTCKECVLQVVEFMSSHGLNVPGGCFYHHCANISISAQSVTVDAGGESGASSSSGATSGASSGVHHELDALHRLDVREWVGPVGGNLRQFVGSDHEWQWRRHFFLFGRLLRVAAARLRGGAPRGGDRGGRNDAPPTSVKLLALDAGRWAFTSRMCERFLAMPR